MAVEPEESYSDSKHIRSRAGAGRGLNCSRRTTRCWCIWFTHFMLVYIISIPRGDFKWIYCQKKTKIWHWNDFIRSFLDGDTKNIDVNSIYCSDHRLIVSFRTLLLGLRVSALVPIYIWTTRVGSNRLLINNADDHHIPNLFSTRAH